MLATLPGPRPQAPAPPGLPRSVLSRGWRPSWRTAAWVATGLVLWLELLSFNRLIAIAGIDPSWRAMISEAAVRGWQFGPEVIFTYGPLAFLATGTFLPELFWPRVLYEAVTKVFLVLIFLRAARRLPGVERGVFLGLLVFIQALDWDAPPYAATGWEAQCFLALLLATLLFGFGGNGSRSTLAWAAVFFAAGASLVKNTYLLFSLFALGCVVLDGLFRARGKRELRWGAPSLFAAGVVGFWAWSGQRLVNLPGYLRGSADIVSGYVSMGLPANPLALGLSLALGLVAMAQIAFLWTRRDDRSHGGLMQIGLWLGALLLAWKQGFTRADQYHIRVFAGYAVLAVTVAPAFFPARNFPRPVRWSALAAALCLGFFAVNAEAPGFWRNAPAGFAGRLAANAVLLVHPETARGELNGELARSREHHALPRVRAAVGGAAVGVFGYDQAVAILNGLNFRPAPMIQGYQVNTPRLAALNRAHYRSERAPDFLLLKLQAIDGRYPTLDDAAALAEVWQRYRPVLTENEYLLLRRVNPPGPETGRLVARGKLAWDAPLPLPGTGVFWLELEVDDMLPGQLRAGFYHRPEVRMLTAAPGGEVAIWVLPPGMARLGFLVGPGLGSTKDFLRLLEGAPEAAARTSAILVHVADEERPFVSPGIGYRLYELSSPPIER